jgi:hypothetical protein
MNYPNEWLCKNCYRRLDKHKPYHKYGRLWCFWYKDNPTREQAEWSFMPVDNLTQIERMANELSL